MTQNYYVKVLKYLQTCLEMLLQKYNFCCIFLPIITYFNSSYFREALLAEMGVALKQDGGTIGVFTPKKVCFMGFCTSRLYCYRKDAFFPSKSKDIFLISTQKHMLWVLIRSVSVKYF